MREKDAAAFSSYQAQSPICLALEQKPLCIRTGPEARPVHLPTGDHNRNSHSNCLFSWFLSERLEAPHLSSKLHF